jgi:tryptophan-rich sensory protein
MPIDEPGGDELRRASNIEQTLGEASAPLPPEPSQPLLDEGEDVVAVERATVVKRRLAVDPRSLVGVVLIGGTTIAAALLGHAALKPKSKRWYRSLEKPSWTPPEKAFGLVWPFLYSLSAVSAWRVWRSPRSRERSVALGIWAAQMATNAVWTTIFFRKKRPVLALVDLQANLAAAAGYSLAASKVDRAAGLLMIPYVAWVAFAGTINSSVVRRNA